MTAMSASEPTYTVQRIIDSKRLNDSPFGHTNIAVAKVTDAANRQLLEEDGFVVLAGTRILANFGPSDHVDAEYVEKWFVGYFNSFR